VLLYTWRRTGLADEAIPHAAGGEGGHGAVRANGVIHRFIPNKFGGGVDLGPQVHSIFGRAGKPLALAS
jgi:hypothetical protein